MAKRKAKRSTPRILLWDQKMQARLEETLEALRSLVADLSVMMAAKKKGGEAASKANATRKLNGENHNPSSLNTSTAGKSTSSTIGEFNFAGRESDS